MSAAAGASRMRAILHPTDLTTASDQAFAHALRIALAGRMKFYILHAESAAQAVDWDAFPAARRTLARWGQLPADSAPEAVKERLGVQLVKLQIPERDSVKAILSFPRRPHQRPDRARHPWPRGPAALSPRLGGRAGGAPGVHPDPVHSPWRGWLRRRRARHRPARGGSWCQWMPGHAPRTRCAPHGSSVACSGRSRPSTCSMSVTRPTCRRSTCRAT